MSTRTTWVCDCCSAEQTDVSEELPHGWSMVEWSIFNDDIDEHDLCRNCTVTLANTYSVLANGTGKGGKKRGNN